MIVGIIDLGINNLTSVQRAFSVPLKPSDSLVVIGEDSTMKRPDLIILPGLGKFGAGMMALNERKLFEKIKSWTSEGAKVVGICLDEKDYTTHNFMQWFVSEQIEEEGTARSIMDKIKLIGDDKGGLYLFDRDLQTLAAKPINVPTKGAK